MRQHRVYLDTDLSSHKEVTLDERAMHYLINVLRLKNHSLIQVFNGKSGSYSAKLAIKDKRHATLLVDEYNANNHQSPLDIELLQAISKPDHMDYVIQKATELGAHQITPIITQRCQSFHLKNIDKKIQRWQDIAINACEQCGRNILPTLNAPLALADVLNSMDKNRIYGVLDLYGDRKFSNINPQTKAISFFIGPEGGFTEEELNQIKQSEVTSVRLGSRVLRTETAASSVLSLAQGYWGDWR